MQIIRQTGQVGTLLLALQMMPAQAENTVLMLESGIAATLNLPDGATLAPAVLMLHGFGSSRDEVAGMYIREAAALEAQGIASLRIDFRGFGKSDGDTGSTTIDLQLEDALQGLEVLAATDGVDPARIGVLGFSLGGGVAMLLAEAKPDMVKSLVTWSSVGDFDADMRGVISEAAFARAETDGIVGLDLGWRTIALKNSFFQSLLGRDLTASIAAYPGAYLTIAGELDFSAAYGVDFVAAAAGSVKEAMIVPGGDHIFGVFGPDAAMSEGVVTKTAEWFAQTL